MFRRRRLDAETGLYYYRNRMMSSELERFLQRYPFGYVDGWNLYEYVGGRFLGRVTKVSKNAIDPHCDSSSRDECLYGIFIEEKIRCGSTFFRLFTVLLHGAFYLAHRNKYHTHRKRRYAGHDHQAGRPYPPDCSALKCAAPQPVLCFPAKGANRRHP